VAVACKWMQRDDGTNFSEEISSQYI